MLLFRHCTGRNTEFTGSCSHAFLGEEGGVVGNSESELLWAIDPLDGTTNFSHNYPSFGVFVAGASPSKDYTYQQSFDIHDFE